MTESHPIDIVSEASRVLKIEAQGLLHLSERIDAQFQSMIDAILGSTGRVIVSGIGKSGLVGRKIVATLNSTGTRAMFLHPVEAMHGDLGMVDESDILLAMSNSGETDELNILIQSIRSIGCKIIAFTGNPGSTLAKCSDIVIDTGVEQEACPLGLAPTASTTALLAMGDALAVVLIKKKQFKTDDFKRFHPGGALGQRLYAKVRDLMMTDAMIPRVKTGSTMEAALKEIDRLELGAVLIVDADDSLAGIVTDGDVRRFLARRKGPLTFPVDDIMTRNPRALPPSAPAYDALNLMEKHQITVLPITDKHGKVRGLLHLHDILGKGEFKFNGGPSPL